MENAFKPMAEQSLHLVIRPLVEKEQAKGGVRADWFANDFRLLHELVQGLTEASNPYLQFNWEEEISKFWSSVDYQYNAPLFAQALGRYFTMPSLPSIPALTQVFSDAFNYTTLTTKIKSVNLRIPSEPTLPKPMTSQNTRRKKRITVTPSIVHEEEPQEPQEPQHKPRKTWSSDKSDVSQRSLTQLNDSLPLFSENENASFALTAVCGPSVGEINVLDVIHDAETGQILVATAGSEDRMDRRICVWDVRKDALVATLDNQTSKPVVAVMFHPSFPELLLSADMSCDVKLWNWKESRCIRWWKRHHSRIIFQIGFVPGDDTRAISCSGDQSIRIWNIHADRTHGGNVHANEPITSFAFCGSTTDPNQQKLIVSLSSSLRIYKLRTLQMIHNISLRDVKPK